MGPDDVCPAVHGLVGSLPLFRQPSDVPIADGLYFFYESGETSPHASDGRIVRIGSHPHSDGRLVGRLREHYSGRKNSSVFRRYLGGALMRADDPRHPCLAPAPGEGHWERRRGKPCDRCRPIEGRVSGSAASSFPTGRNATAWRDC